MSRASVLVTILALLMTAAVPAAGPVAAQAAPQGATESVADPVPSSPTDETTVPHYFGPYPNWANSPLTLPDVNVAITGDGAGAAATASIGADGAITDIAITSPGTGYTSATVEITGAGSGAAATASVTTSGMVTAVEVNDGGAGYTHPLVSFAGGGGTGTLVQVGNPLVDRAYATDYEATPDVRVLVIVPAALPAGTLTEFMSWNQATAGGSPAPSAGNTFHAYVLRPTGVADEYLVVADSGLQTVPALADPAVSEIATYDVTDIPVAAGDVIGFYGAGIPVDTLTGADIFSFPAPTAPVEGATLTVGSPDFPLYGQAREYSFAASVIDTSAVVPLTSAAAVVSGGVDAVQLADGGSGYSAPTVDFDFPDDPSGTQASAHVLWDEATGTITSVVVDDPGSGYSSAPNVVIRNGTLFDPITPPEGGPPLVPATATSTLKVVAITVTDFGSGYTSAPAVSIADSYGGTGDGAAATAHVNAGGVTGVTVTDGGTGYLTPGIAKFTDALPGLCTPPACPSDAAAKYIPIGVPDDTGPYQVGPDESDTYEIGLVQYRTNFTSSMPEGTLARGYVQLETPANASVSQHYPLTNELLDGTKTPVLDAEGQQVFGVTPPQWLGPTILATRDRPVRIVFRNFLPTGADGDLFLPVDSTMMGSGMGPMPMPPAVDDGTVMDEVRNPACTGYPKPDMCFADNRATLHLHGGITPWISDGTPHQWVTPANETTPWPEGVSTENVPDMDVCSADDDGCQTFYYTNQQSARLMFYHDHSWGITRLNVYAGEAAGYMITDETDQALIASGAVPSDQLPLIIQDRTFVPDQAQLMLQDPTWDSDRWGTKGNFWYHHVYMPAQNPGDPSGMSSFGRWMYGPWFWPPAGDAAHGPIANPYYDPSCKLDEPDTWQYDTDPFCEPPEMPGTPLISTGMEQFNDTPIVNGVAYPTVTLEPKAYRMRVLNAANDRFWNLQWYVGDPTTASERLNQAGQPIGATEVALKADELAAAQIDPVVFPTPDTSISTPGPDWVQIGTEGGFLPAPVVVDGQQVTTWITDPTRFDVGNVDQHSLLLAPAERADAVVDFSRFAGQTLILYNDAPAAFPARIPQYDYYTGAPDLSPAGAPTILPGYGPNTRTIMQVKIAGTPAPAFDLAKLRNEFRHQADGSGVFESGQNPIIVGQAPYNTAYGTNFVTGGDCNSPTPSARCDGYARIDDQGGDSWSFNTIKTPNAKIAVRLEPKAIHDEMNATAFDPFGRMQAFLGLEAIPATPGLQNFIPYPYASPVTEIIDATKLPQNLPPGMEAAPISSGSDGTQIWKFTHNGVDTHPIHFHLYDVQLLNRVSWDNIISPPDLTELGWKETVRINPLQDTYVALRPVIPTIPFDLPNSIRPLDPSMPLGATLDTRPLNPQGQPAAPLINRLVNFGWEYVFHCHILSHEEMDMMRGVSVALAPAAADGLTYTVTGNGNNTRLTLTWNDNSLNETSFVVQRQAGAGGAWSTLGTDPSALDADNTAGVTRSFTDTTFRWNSTTYSYRVVARNSVGYGGDFPTFDADAMSTPVAAIRTPTGLSATLQLPASGLQVRLAFTDNLTIETGFAIERADDGGAFTRIATAPARTSTGGVTFDDTTVTYGHSYVYRVAAETPLGLSGYSNTASVQVPEQPAAPTDVTVAPTGTGNGNNRGVRISWTDASSNETGFTVQRSTSATFTTGVSSTNVAANTTSLNLTITRNVTTYFRIRANNGTVVSSGWVVSTPPSLLIP
jgi:FtsP/CotA-like multicopper oxidase with cupredoxin domain